MTAFYFTLLAVLLSGFGARDQVTVATLAHRQGARPGALVTAVVVAAGTGIFAAWAATLVVPLLIPKARMIMAAMAFAFAGAEALLAVQRRRPEEPTASLGALAIVILAHQLTDAARFLVFAIAVATAAPIPAGIAAAVGGAVLMGLAWAMPGIVTHPRLRSTRRLIGLALLLVGAVLALGAFDRI